MDTVLVAIAINVVVGALLYLDVVRSRRSGWWLIAIWVFLPALLVYVALRLNDWRTTRARFAV